MWSKTLPVLFIRFTDIPCAGLERRSIENELRILSLQKTLADISAKFSWLNSPYELTHFAPFCNFPSSPSSFARSQQNCQQTLPAAASDDAQTTVIDTVSLCQPKPVDVQQSPYSTISDISEADAYMSPDSDVLQPIASKRAASEMQPTQRKLIEMLWQSQSIINVI